MNEMEYYYILSPKRNNVTDNAVTFDRAKISTIIIIIIIIIERSARYQTI